MWTNVAILHSHVRQKECWVLAQKRKNVPIIQFNLRNSFDIFLAIAGVKMSVGLMEKSPPTCSQEFAVTRRVIQYNLPEIELNANNGHDHKLMI